MVYDTRRHTYHSTELKFAKIHPQADREVSETEIYSSSREDSQKSI